MQRSPSLPQNPLGLHEMRAIDHLSIEIDYAGLGRRLEGCHDSTIEIPSLAWNGISRAAVPALRRAPGSQRRLRKC